MKYLKMIFDFINKYTNLTLAIVLLVLFFMYVSQCSRNKSQKQELFKKDQNILALKDTVKVEKTKNGELNSSVNGFVATEKELKALNIELYNQVKSQKGDVLFLNDAILKLTQDTSYLRKYLNSVISQSNQIVSLGNKKYSLPWRLEYDYDVNNYDIFEGRTLIKTNDTSKIEHLSTELIKRTTQIKLSFGQIIENDKLRVFVQSKYPGFTVESLKGVLIDPNDNSYIRKLMKKKHWFNGWQIGIGITPGFNLGTGGYSLVIGPTFSWNIYSF
jgi:hypothetical protein